MAGSENGASIENIYWIFKGKSDAVDRWLLMNNPIPLLLILISYLMFVTKIGPGVMKKRTPFQLNKVIAVYNIVQIVASFFVLYRAFMSMLSQGWLSKCFPSNDEPEDHVNIFYYYFLIKISELMETVFFVLRKKNRQATFLHVYHHTYMCIFSWLVVKYEPSYSALFGLILNCFIHVIMYSYYYLSTFPELAKYLWWKQYLTTMQMIQFLMIACHILICYAQTECPPSAKLTSMLSINVLLFLYMFLNFYKESYNKPAVDVCTTNKQNK